MSGRDSRGASEVLRLKYPNNRFIEAKDGMNALAKAKGRTEVKRAFTGDLSDIVFETWDSAKTWANKSNSQFLKEQDAKGYGIKIDDEGNTLIPARDKFGNLKDILKIKKNGSQEFIGMSDRDGLFHQIGKPSGNKKPKIFADYKEAITHHEKTGESVIYAFHKDNIKKVEKSPNISKSKTKSNKIDRIL